MSTLEEFSNARPCEPGDDMCVDPYPCVVHDHPSDNEARKDLLYWETVKAQWNALGTRGRRKFWRRYPLIAISLEHLIEADDESPRDS